MFDAFRDRRRLSAINAADIFDYSPDAGKKRIALRRLVHNSICKIVAKSGGQDTIIRIVRIDFIVVVVQKLECVQAMHDRSRRKS
jgi:hypothetical protein